MIPNMWYAVLPSRSVLSGKLVAAKRFGVEMVFFRNRKGEVGALVDQCSHRGAALSIGKHDGDCIRCPFHGLIFDEKGLCREIPANGKGYQENLQRYNVKSYPTQEANGIVYVWYGDGQPSGHPPFFSDYIPEGTVYSEIEDHWHAHYSRAIENQLDVVHVPIVHHNTIGRGNKTLINGPKVLFENETLITSANNEVDQGQKPKKPDDCVIKPTFLAFRYPNVWLNHISEKIKVLIYFAPVDDENTILYIRFYSNVFKWSLANRGLAWVGKFANRIIESQDKRVVITQKPKASSLIAHENLIMGDGPIVKYRVLRNTYQKNNGE